jgi:hypothetical protein
VELCRHATKRAQDGPQNAAGRERDSALKRVRYSAQQEGLGHSSIRVHLCSSVVPAPFGNRVGYSVQQEGLNDSSISVHLCSSVVPTPLGRRVRYFIQQEGWGYSSIRVHLCSSVVPAPFSPTDEASNMIATNPQSKNDPTH